MTAPIRKKPAVEATGLVVAPRLLDDLWKEPPHIAKGTATEKGCTR
jgi:hypothetical protein